MATAVLAARVAPAARAAAVRRWPRALAISVIGPALLSLAYPTVGFGPAALVALAPLFLLWSTQSWKEAFWWGWLSGTLAYCLLFAWMASTIFEFVGPFSVLVVVLVCAIEALAVAAVAVTAALVGGGSIRAISIVAIPAAWLLAESLRSYGTLGVPFGALGHAAAHLPLLLPLAALGGVYLLTTVIALANAALAAIAGGDSPTRRAGLITFGALIVLVTAAFISTQRTAYPAPTLRVAIAQGNIDQRVKWSPETFEHAFAMYSELTRQAARQGAQVVVWPETAVTSYPLQDPELLHSLGSLATTNHVWLATGALDQPSGDHLYNAVLAIAPDGSVSGVYHKHLLIPFVEYLPLGSALRRIAFLDNASDFSRGSGAELLPVGGYRWGTLICYESAFALYARNAVNAGADTILMAADDAWFGRTREPYEHADVAVIEAASTGRWIVRSTQSGISEFVDPNGRIVAQLGLGQEGVVVHNIGPGVTTLYDRLGSAWLILLAAIGVVAALLRSRSRVTDAR
jgi:apolipoprotein N-acyltransferase